MPLFLKSLEIAGFKSFARAARLEFPRGITGFVGPNGSGKSNVVDAVRWCLGEQSSRDLRAQRAEDVIHAGPRKVLGAAEVTLTFESEPGDDLPWAELAVGRRLYRSGESEYLVNGQRARLRDLTSSLRLLGIDSGRNVVVTQGMADALLSASPAERRGLLEQAAGLGPYRERRDEAASKLATTRQNIQTIEAVLAEMEPRLRLLRRQARAVQERDEAREMLRRRSEEWYAWRWQDMHRRIDEARRNAEESARARAQRTDELRALEQDAEQALERERILRRDLEAAIGTLHAAERARDSARYELRRLEQARTDAQEKLAVAVSRHATLSQNRQAVSERIESVQQLLREMDQSQEELRAAERQAEAAWSQAREASRTLDARTQSLLGAREAAHRQHADIVERLRRLRIALEDDQQRASGIERRLAEARGTMAQAEEAIQQFEKETRDTEDRVRRLVEVAAQARGAFDAAQVRHERLLGLERRVQRAHSDVSARVTSLSRSVGDLHQQAFGPLAEMRALPGWDEAIAAALGGWAFAGNQSIGQMRLAPSEAFLEWREALGDLPAGAMWADSVLTGLAADLVHPLLLTALAGSNALAEKVWSQLAGKPAYLLGWPPLMVVTQDGTIYDASGVRRAQGDERTARYLRSRRALDVAVRREQILQARLARLVTARDDAARSLEDHRAVSQEQARAVATARRELSESTERKLHAERSRVAALTEQQERSAQLATLQERVRQREMELRAARDTQQEFERDLRIATDAWQTAREEANARGHEVSETAARRASVRRDLEAVTARRSAQAEVLVHARRDLQRTDAEVTSLETDRRGIGMHLGQITAAISEVPPIDALEARVTAQRRNVEALRQREVATPARVDVRRVRDSLSELIANHERALAALGRIEDEARMLGDEITRELRVAPADLPAPPELAPGEDEIRRLRTRATQYADADHSVVEESRDLAERQRHLRANLEDLERAVETLMEIMSAADTEMRTRFDLAFTAVNEEFSRVFQVMLRGGEANLERTGEDGVDIRARLPGRRARSSAAFSGGERSLVASALLFGVLKIRPTPFCLLDEVDAALDESNVDRYLAVLRDIGQRTQIMVVTHNRATMAAADVLYGLTMNDEGASNVLSLRLDAYASA